LPGSRYCGLPQHQALARFPTNQVTVLATLSEEEVAKLADTDAGDGEVQPLVDRAMAAFEEGAEEPAAEEPPAEEPPAEAQPAAAEEAPAEDEAGEEEQGAEEPAQDAEEPAQEAEEPVVEPAAEAESEVPAAAETVNVGESGEGGQEGETS
jgi:ubiquinol-cytochrome c reductase cytochrome c1 subunit